MLFLTVFEGRGGAGCMAVKRKKESPCVQDLADNHPNPLKEKEDFGGRGNSPNINSEKGDTLAQKGRDSPPPQSYKTGRASGDVEVRPVWHSPADRAAILPV
eukprot:1138316-Pelagomonas_calceolata.AAC.1